MTPRLPDLDLLACPACRGELTGLGARTGSLACAGCGLSFPILDGIPWLHRESVVGGADRFMRALYDGLGALHDPGVRYALSLAQGMSEDTLRRRIVAWLELDQLDQLDHPAHLDPRDGANADADTAWRILEVGVGTGANLPFLADALPPGRETVVWGVDLSRKMLALCARRARRARRSGLDVHLAGADAHALPFADASFDRVFHVGGIGSYRDPRAALAEMARVAKAGTPIVVVDEELDRSSQPGLLARLAFRAIVFNQWRPRAPLDALPPDATEVDVAPLSPFYYVLRFVRAA